MNLPTNDEELFNRMVRYFLDHIRSGFLVIMVSWIILLCITGCRSSADKGQNQFDDLLFKATDFTDEGLFTSGIEGPATDHKGNLYASDPNWSDSTGKLWKIGPDGDIILLEDSMGTTNGLEVSPDEKRLYVNESVQRRIWVYHIGDGGNLYRKKLFASFPDFGLDGMRCDTAGNLYITRYGKGTVLILSSEGKEVEEVKLIGSNPTNIAFGGPDGCTCYVTLADRGCIEFFRVPYPGRSFAMRSGNE